MIALGFVFVAFPLFSATRASSLPPFTDFVTFGDSYTDVAQVSDGGVAWPVYAASYANVNLHPFARSGATCSSALSNPANISPPVMESQIPAYQNASKQTPLNQEQTVYTLWIGTNDVGTGGGLITGDAPQGVTVVNVTECAVSWVAVMHGLGARNFIFMNMIPLQLVPRYAANSHPAISTKTTAWPVVMNELVTSGNTLSSVLLRALAPVLPDSRIALFDTHSLFADMYENPGRYLNGTAPLNVTGSVQQCQQEIKGGPVGGACPPDSFLWYNDLHPSEQADRIVAREIAAAFKGNTTWATWLS